MLHTNQLTLFCDQTQNNNNKKRNRSKNNLELIDFELLVNQAAPVQKQEAARLYSQYGKPYAHRYLQAVVTQKKLPPVVINNPNWDANELVLNFPKDWKFLLAEFLKHKSAVTGLIILQHLVPNYQANYDTPDKDGYIPLYDPCDVRKAIEVIEQRLQKMGWKKSQNPRIFFNPSIKYETIVLKAKEKQQVSLGEILKEMDLVTEFKNELIKFLEKPLIKAGFTIYSVREKNTKEYVLKRPLFFLNY